jgi:hypothetical protein
MARLTARLVLPPLLPACQELRLGLVHGGRAPACDDPEFRVAHSACCATATRALWPVRGTLVGYSAQLPGARVLEDHYGAIINRIAIAKGNAERLAYINEFVEEAKASGLVQRAIERAGPAGLTVAPVGDSN